MDTYKNYENIVEQIILDHPHLKEEDVISVLISLRLREFCNKDFTNKEE